MNPEKLELLITREMPFGKYKGRIIAEGTPQQVKDRFNQKSLEDVFISVARGGDVMAAGEEAAR